jgi:hypothetical protein
MSLHCGTLVGTRRAGSNCVPSSGPCIRRCPDPSTGGCCAPPTSRCRLYTPAGVSCTYEQIPMQAFMFRCPGSSATTGAIFAATASPAPLPRRSLPARPSPQLADAPHPDTGFHVPIQAWRSGAKGGGPPMSHSDFQTRRELLRQARDAGGVFTDFDANCLDLVLVANARPPDPIRLRETAARRRSDLEPARKHPKEDTRTASIAATRAIPPNFRMKP